MIPIPLYSVFGVRSDKDRLLICDHLTKEQAERTKAMIENGKVFSSVMVEPVDPTHPTLDLKPADDGQRPT
jgi:hypothetical protein